MQTASTVVDMFNKLYRLIEWVLDTFVSLFVRRQEVAKDAKQSALAAAESEESPNATQVTSFFCRFISRLFTV